MSDNSEQSAENAADMSDSGGIQVRGLNSDVLERLRDCVDRFGNAAKLAKTLGVSASSLSDNLSGRREPRASLIAAIAKATGRSIDWIMFGEASQLQSQSQDSVFATPSDVILVPYYNVRASAGPGALPLHEEPSETFALDRRFARTLGITATNVAALTVHGDSAQPNLSEGDTILVDRAYLDLRDGGLYVIGVDEDIIVKRVHRQADRSVILKSDNPAYEPQHVSAGDVERLRVIGRVRWAVRGF